MGLQCVACYKLLEDSPPVLAMSNLSNGNGNENQGQASSSSTPTHQSQVKIVTSIGCGHIFHDICIKSWLAFPASNGTCPNRECCKACTISDLIPITPCQTTSPQDEKLVKELNEAKVLIEQITKENMALKAKQPGNRCAFNSNKSKAQSTSTAGDSDNAIDTEEGGSDTSTETIIVQTQPAEVELVHQVQDQKEASNGTMVVATPEKPSSKRKSSNGNTSRPFSQPKLRNTQTMKTPTGTTKITNNKEVGTTKPKLTTSKQLGKRRTLKNDEILFTYLHHELSARDFYNLNQLGYLTANVTDFWLSEFLSKLIPGDRQNRDRIHLFPTSFYTKLQTQEHSSLAYRGGLGRPTEFYVSDSYKEYCHLQVQHYTNDVDIFSKDCIIIPIDRSRSNPSPKHAILVDCIAIICFGPLNGAPTVSMEGKKYTRGTKATDISTGSGPGVVELNKSKDTSCIILFDTFKNRNKNSEIIFEHLKGYLQVEYKKKQGGNADEFGDTNIQHIKSIIPNLTDPNNDNSSYLVKAVEEFIKVHLITKYKYPPIINYYTWFPSQHSVLKRKGKKFIRIFLEWFVFITQGMKN